MSQENEGKSAVATPPKAEPKKDKKPKILPPYNVVLLDDDDHTYEYVIRMLMKLFGHPLERSYQMAREVDTEGRVIVETTTKERAEFKRDQIHAYGRDPLIERCKGSMQAIIEPCPG